MTGFVQAIFLIMLLATVLGIVLIRIDLLEIKRKFGIKEEDYE